MLDKSSLRERFQMLTWGDDQLFPQIEFGPRIGGVKDQLQRSVFYFSFAKTIVIWGIAYETWPLIAQIFPSPYLWYLTVPFGFLGFALADYIIMKGSQNSFNQHQITAQRAPWYQDLSSRLERIESSLDSRTDGGTNHGGAGPAIAAKNTEDTTATGGVAWESVSKANLGCGHDYRDGEDWLNVDIREDVDKDHYLNLNEIPWTIAGERVPDGAFQHVVMTQVPEHLHDLHAGLVELHRVLGDDGTAYISGPHWNSPSAWIDSTHVRPFDPRTFSHENISPYYEVVEVNAHKVRFGRILPDGVAFWLADHIGHIVAGFDVTVRKKKLNDEGDTNE